MTAEQARRRYYSVTIHSNDCEGTSTDFSVVIPQTQGLPTTREVLVTVTHVSVHGRLPAVLNGQDIVTEYLGYLGVASLAIVSPDLAPVNSYDTHTKGPTDIIYVQEGSAALTEYDTNSFITQDALFRLGTSATNEATPFVTSNFFGRRIRFQVRDMLNDVTLDPAKFERTDIRLDVRFLDDK